MACIVGVGAMILSHVGRQLVAESRPVNINLPHLAYTVQTFLYLQEVPIKTFRNKVARSRQDSIACFSSFVRSLDFMIFLDIYLQVEHCDLVGNRTDSQIKLQNYKG